ncbi:YbdD/YjiX family protein [Arthrobacter sp. NPDC090010]|uniref:YbdD/YjiX family protein n=1 Tax=Arthrobacter sp. NPDC090010 TaxID=3363942 RepID=UPI00382D4406
MIAERTTTALPSSSGRAVARGAWRRVRAGASAFRRGIRGVFGADAYEKYLEYHRQHHPHHAPMSEPEFWRDRCDRQEGNPQGRCC